jgi:PAS domain S-box-containing protein
LLRQTAIGKLSERRMSDSAQVQRHAQEAQFAAQRLKSRGSRAPDYSSEHHSISQLLRALVDQPERIMHSIALEALELCHAHAGGVSLRRSGSSNLFNVEGLAGEHAAKLIPCHATEANPWRAALEHGEPVLFERPERIFPCLQDLGAPIEEVLIAPIHLPERPLGVVWAVSHDPSLHFDAEHGRLLCAIGQVAAVGHRIRTASERRSGDPETMRDRLAELSREVTERSRVADALVRSEERLRLAMEATDFGTLEWEIEPDRVTCSPNVKRLFGFASGQALRLEDVLSHIHPEDRAAVRETIRAAMDSRGPRTYVGEFRTISVNGRVGWIDARGAVLFRELGQRPQCLVGIVLDITARKEAEAQLQRTAQDLGTANRIKDEFMATLAHELRNPLTPIRNSLEILELTGIVDPTQRRACNVMGRQLRHLVHLVDDLLDVSRITQRRLRLRPEVVSLRRVFDGAVEVILPQIDAAQHRLRVELPETPILVQADPVRLIQAVGNLLANSARYTPAGGEILLRASVKNDEVEIEVTDNGIGISAEMLPHLFEMFTQAEHRTRRSDAGLGIGLALTRALVELHHGRIEAYSAGPNRGASFRIWLPVLSATKAESSGEAMHQRARSTVRRRVLIVDDEADSADTMAALLGVMGHETHIARDGAHGVQAAEAFAPDLILMDIGMPGMDGHEAARRIRALALAKRPLIVALTGWAQETERRKSYEAGMDAYLLKPVDPGALDRLFDRLDAAESRSSAHPPDAVSN